MSDAVTDTVEYSFDQLAEQLLTDDLERFIPAIQDLPIVKYFISAGKIVNSVRDRLFLKKTLKFFAALHNGEVESHEIERRQQALSMGEQWVIDELEILISTLEQVNRVQKAQIIAEIYRTYLSAEIDKKMFDDFCAITENLFLGDIIQIRADFESNEEKRANEEAIARGETPAYLFKQIRYLDLIGRLVALGLMRISLPASRNSTHDSSSIEYSFTIEGQKYAEILSKINFLEIK